MDTTGGDTMTDTTARPQGPDEDDAQEWAALVVELGTEKLDAQDEAERQGRA